MNRSSWSEILRRLSLLALLVISAGTAHATTDVPRDRTDNTYTFTYNADEGDITLAASSRRITRNDRVSFLVGVRSDPEAEVGERLVGRISLQLHARKSLRYDGTFSLLIRTAEGEVVLKQERKETFVLRPRDGQRRAGFRMRFDLPSGDYEAHAKFQSHS